MTELQLAAMRQARETLLIAAANFGGLAPAMRDRCIRDANALHEVYIGQAAAQPAVQQPAENAPSDAMVDAYLTAQRAAVEEADRFGRPNAGGLHTNTVREACRAGLAAAIKAQGGKQ